MGQARQKQEHIRQCNIWLRQLGDEGATQDERTLAIDNLLLSFGQKLFDLDSGSTLTHNIYQQAMRHDDLRIQHGMQIFMDIFLGYAWKGTHPAAQSLTVALFCGLELPALDMVGSITDTRSLREWLSKKLEVTRDRIDIYASTVDPTLCYQDINSLVLDFYGAKESYKQGQAKKTSERYGPESPDAQDYVVFLATVRFDNAVELDKMVERIEAGISISTAEHFDAPYEVDNKVEYAVINPLHIDMPFSALKNHAFYYAQQKLRILVEQAGEQGYTPEQLRMEVNVGTPRGAPHANQAAVYAELYQHSSNTSLGQRYICQVDYAPFGMGAALDVAAETGVGSVLLNGVLAYDTNTPT